MRNKIRRLSDTQQGLVVAGALGVVVVSLVLLIKLIA